jgi:hypothetical protein
MDPAWQWPWDQANPPAVDPSRGGWLRLRTAAAAAPATFAIAARPTLAGTYTATTVVDVSSLNPRARAGLAAFGNRDNMLSLTVERTPPSADAATNGTLTFTVWQVQKAERRALATERMAASDMVHLRLEASDRTRFDFAISADGQRWQRLGGPADGGYLPPWDLSIRVALLVFGPPDASARFGAFRLETSDR